MSSCSVEYNVMCDGCDIPVFSALSSLFPERPQKALKCSPVVKCNDNRIKLYKTEIYFSHHYEKCYIQPAGKKCEFDAKSVCQSCCVVTEMKMKYLACGYVLLIILIFIILLLFIQIIDELAKCMLIVSIISVDYWYSTAISRTFILNTQLLSWRHKEPNRNNNNL